MTGITHTPRRIGSQIIVITMLAVTLLAFLLRITRLMDVPPRWDEGWSIAHASLPLIDLLAITAADVHPPLFYLLLGIWQSVLGTDLFSARYLAVLMSLPAIPLTFAAARAWLGGKNKRGEAMVPVLAAALMAWLPLAVYYSAVVRMYALAPSFVVLACWAGLRLVKITAADGKGNSTGKQVVFGVAFVIGAAGAMLTLYHAVWALLALGVYLLALALGQRHLRLHRLRALAVSVGVSILVTAPWLVYAIPKLAERAAQGSGNLAQQQSVDYLMGQGVIALTMAYRTGWLGVLVIGLVVLVGAVSWLARTIRARTRIALQPHMHLVLPVLAITLTLLGVAVAARNWTFNARMVICAAPFLAMWMAWALGQWAQHSRVLTGIVCVIIIAVFFNTSTDFVYQKTLEVFDPYNPYTYWQRLNGKTTASDLLFFNVLSPAGFYALDRSATDAQWSYALTWDPVIEPPEQWQQRIESAAQRHSRVWIILYRGLAGKNGDLRGWMDSHWFPASAEWGEEEVFYGLYGMHLEELHQVISAPIRWRSEGFHLKLVQAELSPSVPTGAIIPVKLTWMAETALQHDYKVFVHAFDEQGALIAQHDAQPLNDLRPMSSLPAGEIVEDRHGLALPQSFTGKLRIVVGLYDPYTGDPIADENGLTAIELGLVAVTP